MPNGQQYCPYYPDPDGERERGREREREHEREREREREQERERERERFERERFERFPFERERERERFERERFERFPFERERFERHFGEFFPPVALEFFPHIRAVVDEMDDLNFPLLPRERFDAMTDRIMNRIEGAELLQFPGSDFDRRRELARGLIVSLLIAELLRRRRRFFFI